MPVKSDNYLRLERVVSSLLQAHDPDGMGSSVFAPVDEWEPLP